MIIEQEYPDLTKWPILLATAGYWVQTLLILIFLGLGVAVFREVLLRFLDTWTSRGLGSALIDLPANIFTGLLDTIRTLAVSVIEVLALPLGYRRIWAIARLSIQEAVRRRVLYVLLLFLIPFLFAGWYLSTAEEAQLRILVSFTNTVMGWLLLPMVLFVAAMSIPKDLESRTIQTVVTKPVRRLELIVGRVLGFMVVFTFVIAIMGGISLAYIYSQVTDKVLEDQWTARVPVYASPPQPNAASFAFVKQGAYSEVGTNVGREWGYRSHIEGDTSDEARWFFTFDPALFAGSDRVKVGVTFDVFKTTKGSPTLDEDDTSGVWASLDFIDRKDPKNKADEAFRVNNNRVTMIEIPGSVLKSGELVVRARCLTRNQFLGMAKHDIYLQAQEQPFESNFLKGMISLWLKVLFLTSVAVAASTVLNGFVTVIFTVGVYCMGIFHNFLVQVGAGQTLGGGPIESAVRLVLQMNQTIELDPGFFRSLSKTVDPILLYIVGAVGQVIPDLSTIETAEYVASGFNIPTWLMLRNIILVVGYVVPVLIAGYLLFRNRETAA